MLTLFISFFVLLLIGVPVAVSIGLSALLSLVTNGYPIIIIAQKMITGIDSFTFIAIPMFILAGELMNVGKITDRIFNFAKAVVGWVPGGLAHANIFASVIFAGMSGSAIADAGGLGTVELKAMKESGFEDYFSGAVTAASSTIGPIFPPSIPMVIYGGIASVSIGKLFLGGVVPGLLMAVALSVYALVVSLKMNFPREKFSLKGIALEFIRAFIPLLTPVIILSGFVTGWFTPTEASSIAVVYALIVGGLVYRAMGWKSFIQALKNTGMITANVVFIIGSATLFSFILTNQGITEKIATAILSVSTNPWAILAFINVILFLLGLIMEPGAILIMMLPVFLPIVTKVNIDLVHFGVTMVLNLMIGQITPPFGMCLFTIAQVGNLKLEKLSRAIIPWIIPLVAVLMLSLFIPQLVLWLPNLLMK
ncbi:MAG: TRAP transporter large permease [Treponemataceae bacterium]